MILVSHAPVPAAPHPKWEAKSRSKGTTFVESHIFKAKPRRAPRLRLQLILN